MDLLVWVSVHSEFRTSPVLGFRLAPSCTVEYLAQAVEDRFNSCFVPCVGARLTHTSCFNADGHTMHLHRVPSGTPPVAMLDPGVTTVPRFRVQVVRDDKDYDVPRNFTLDLLEVVGNKLSLVMLGTHVSLPGRSLPPEELRALAWRVSDDMAEACGASCRPVLPPESTLAAAPAAPPRVPAAVEPDVGDVPASAPRASAPAPAPTPVSAAPPPGAPVPPLEAPVSDAPRHGPDAAASRPRTPPSQPSAALAGAALGFPEPSSQLVYPPVAPSVAGMSEVPDSTELDLGGGPARLRVAQQAYRQYRAIEEEDRNRRGYDARGPVRDPRGKATRMGVDLHFSHIRTVPEAKRWVLATHTFTTAKVLDRLNRHTAARGFHSHP